MHRAGDVNRHAYASPAVLRNLLAEVRWELLDLHEEPFSVAARQWLRAAPSDLPVVMYTAQNVDKRFPPPFAQYEQAAHRRVAGLYPCSAQAASVARGKGFAGALDVLPLGYDATAFWPHTQAVAADELVLGFFGRLVPEKGLTDAVRILARLNATRPTQLLVAGSGPDKAAGRALAASLGVADRLEIEPWLAPADLAAAYRRAHVVLVPSRATHTWVEQFGRVIVEAQASGAVVAGYASGSIPEVAGEAAILTQVGAHDELADRIAAVVADPAEFGRLRSAGVAQSAGRTWTRVAEGQAALHGRVASGQVASLRLPRSPSERRAQAREEFGPRAETASGMRPFAVPVLRAGGVVAAALAETLDASVELAARARR